MRVLVADNEAVAINCAMRQPGWTRIGRTLFKDSEGFDVLTVRNLRKLILVDLHSVIYVSTSMQSNETVKQVAQERNCVLRITR